MSEEKQFYVYVHRKATDGSIFYVGKGKGRRIYDKKRNQHWKHIVNKHGFTADIVMRFESEMCAFSFERALIKLYGRSNLCNLTDGGEGVSGFKYSEEIKAKMSASKIGTKHTRETKLRMSAARMGHVTTRETRLKISNAQIGKKNSPEARMKISLSRQFTSSETREKMSLAKRGRKSYRFDYKIYNFLSPDGLIEMSTQYDLYNKYGLSRGHLSSVVSGKRKTHKGWSLAVDTQLQLW